MCRGSWHHHGWEEHRRHDHDCCCCCYRRRYEWFKPYYPYNHCDCD